jgi:ATP-binding cassette subfamily A (ABC1) protein 3
LALQYATDKAIIGQVNSSINNVDLQLQRFFYPPYNNDNFVAVIQAVFPLIIIISFIITVILTAKAIVHEKETGIKEAMRLMGMKPWIYWLSWYIKTFTLLLPAVIFMMISYKIKLNLDGGGKAAIINQTDPVLFAVFLLLYVSSTITFTFMCTTFFKKANSAAAGAGIIFFLTYIPYIFISLRYQTLSMIEKILPLFLSNLAMSMGVQLIGERRFKKLSKNLFLIYFRIPHKRYV